jgi:hypothetical protein
MFLCDVVTAQFNRKTVDTALSDSEVKSRLTTRLRTLGYIGTRSKIKDGEIEKIIISVANSKPEMLKVIGEPLVYRFMDRERN